MIGKNPFFCLGRLIRHCSCCSLNSRSKIGGVKRLATSKTVSNLRKFKSVSDSKLSELKTKLLKKRTYKMQWGVRTFKDRRSDRLSTPETFDPVIFEVDLDVVGSLKKESLCYALCRFIPEITKKDGTDYPGKTLYEMITSVQKYLNQKSFAMEVN